MLLTSLLPNICTYSVSQKRIRTNAHSSAIYGRTFAKNFAIRPESWAGVLSLLMNTIYWQCYDLSFVTLLAQKFATMPMQAIGIESGSSGWKKTAVNRMLATFENKSAMSRSSPSYNLHTFSKCKTYSLASAWVRRHLSPSDQQYHLLNRIMITSVSNIYVTGLTKEIESMMKNISWTRPPFLNHILAYTLTTAGTTAVLINLQRVSLKATDR